jgi:DNA-directed RNA polymerase specialized sigma24 family protein
MTPESWIAPLHAYGLRVAAKYSLHDPALDEEDLVQQAWLTAYERLAGIPDDEGRKKFIAVAIRNHYYRSYQRRKIRPEISLDAPARRTDQYFSVETQGRAGDAFRNAIPGAPDIADRAIAAVELQALVARARAGDAFAAAAILHGAYGHHEAAAIAGVNHSTLGSRVLRFRRGERYEGKGTLKPAQVAEIRRLLADGVRYSAIMARFSIARPTISEIATGKAWKEVA